MAKVDADKAQPIAALSLTVVVEDWRDASGDGTTMILEHTVNVGDREFASFSLTQSEADAMIAAGFRFAIYDKGEGRFELEAPFGQSADANAGTSTFRQEALPNTIEISDE